jgi:hypothetical protein
MNKLTIDSDNYSMSVEHLGDGIYTLTVKHGCDLDGTSIILTDEQARNAANLLISVTNYQED